MKGKNYKLMGMKAMAVFSILSMTVFSFSYNVAYAHGFSEDSEYVESHNDNSSHDQKHEDSEATEYNSDTNDSHSDYSKDDSDSSDEDESEDNKSSHDDKDHNSNGPSKNKKDDKKDHDKITICHATHSETNPYILVTISASGKDAHNHHQDSEDIIPAPKDGCPDSNHNDDENHHGDEENDEHHDDGHDEDDEEDNHGCDEHDYKGHKNCGIENAAPVITLNGSSTVTVFVGDLYTDLGARANDKEDGDITADVVSISNVDTTKLGTYTVAYNVMDSKGSCAETVVRTVVVKPASETNTAPVITLIGLNPITVYEGDIYLDPGATAQDHEDGNLTSSIVKTGSVDVNTVGTYTITYNVKDSKGLSAATVTRTVNIIPVQTINKGKITFCLVLATDQNNIATSSYALPQGTFTLSLATTTSNIASTTIRTQTWNSETFSPNRKAILNQNDSDCVTYDNLEYGDYLYSSVAINGASWNSAKYNDQNDQPVNNAFDFFQYSNTNTNSDGIMILGPERSERTLYLYVTYKPASQCLLPEINSALTVNAVVNQSFTYTLSASSTSSVAWEIATTSLPTGVTFATSTNTISGVPVAVGTYVVSIKAVNACGFDERGLTINVSNNNTGGGGGSTPTANLAVVKIANRGAANTGDEVAYTITLENKGPNDATSVRVTDILPSQLDFVSASTSVGAYATSTGVWLVGNFANGSSTSLVIIGKVKSGTEGQNIANTATVVADQSDSDTSNNTSTVNVGVINPNNNGGGGGGSTGGGGGSNGPIVGSYGGGGSTGGQVLSSGISALPVVQGCNYLLDYLRRDFNNNPYEVTKLQLFLKNLEGFTELKVTGIYDQETIDAVNVFQLRYKDDVLTPWGHTAPTSYVYILTKKKVNEIYCKMAFPVSSAQQEEIDNYRNSHSFGNSSFVPVVSNEVGYVNGSNSAAVNPTVSVNPKDVIVTNATSSTKTATSTVENVANISLTTLAGFSSSTKGAASDFVANIISSGKRIGGLLGSIFAIPGMLFTGINKNACTTSSNVMSGLNLILLVIIALLSYFWYRERKNNKTIEEINKEIDLK